MKRILVIISVLILMFLIIASGCGENPTLGVCSTETALYEDGGYQSSSNQGSEFDDLDGTDLSGNDHGSNTFDSRIPGQSYESSNQSSSKRNQSTSTIASSSSSSSQPVQPTSAVSSTTPTNTVEYINDVTLAKAILNKVNDYRESKGLCRLEWNQPWADRAETKARYNYENKIGDELATHDLGQIGCATWTGYVTGDGKWENRSGFWEIQDSIETASEEAFQTWYNSPPHNANMLYDTRTKAGVAAVKMIKNGKWSTLVVILDFGTLAEQE